MSCRGGKFDQKVKGLSHGFRRFFDHFQSIPTWMYMYLTDLSLVFNVFFRSKNLIQKQRLSYVFWLFFDYFQSIPTRFKDGRLAEMS